jgi:hypothetical protein
MEMRIHVLDAVCAQRKGHNLQALKNHLKLLAEIPGVERVNAYGSTLLQQTCLADDIGSVRPCLPFPYDDVLPISNSRDERVEFPGIPYATPIDPQHELRRGALDLPVKKSRHAVISDECLNYFKTLYITERISSRDVFFFPSADYYSMRSVLKLLDNTNVKKSPLTCFRLINVMEHWTTLTSEPLTELMGMSKTLIKRGHKIAFAAESVGYCYSLGKTYGVDVTHLPYIPQRLALPGKQVKSGTSDGRYNVLFPGSQRYDKGVTRIPEIVSRLTDRLGMKRIHFILQLPNVHEIRNFSALYKELTKYPNVEIQPSTISEKRLRENFEKSHLICLPYQEETYDRNRSSGSLVEAALYGKPIVSSSCEGFKSEIEFFKFGACAGSTNEICDLIFNYSKLEQAALETEMRLSMARYFGFVSGAYQSFLGGLKKL